MAIKRLADRYGLYLLENGSITFFPARPLGCYGDGGVIFTDNEEWAKMMHLYMKEEEQKQIIETIVKKPGR